MLLQDYSAAYIVASPLNFTVFKTQTTGLFLPNWYCKYI